MRASRQSISKQITELGPSAKTPGTLGILDSGGDTPGTLGFFDHGDITICKRSEEALKIHSFDRVPKLVTIEFNKIASVLEIWLYLFEPKASVRRRWKKFYSLPNAPRTIAPYWINLKQRRKSAYEDMDEIFDSINKSGRFGEIKRSGEIQKSGEIVGHKHSFIEIPEKLYTSKVLARIRPDLLKLHPELKFKIPQTELDLMRISQDMPEENKKRLEELKKRHPELYSIDNEHIRAVEKHIKSSYKWSSAVLVPDVREWADAPDKAVWFTHHLKNVLIDLPVDTVLGNMTFIYSTGPTTISTVMWKKHHFFETNRPALMRGPWKSFHDVLANLLFDKAFRGKMQDEVQKKVLTLIERKWGKKSKK